MGDEREPVGKEGADHQLGRIVRRAGGSLGDDIEAIEGQPRGASEDVGWIDIVCACDEVDHGGVAEEVSVSALHAPTYARMGPGRAGVDVGDLKGGCGCWRRAGLGEERDPKKEGKGNACECLPCGQIHRSNRLGVRG